MIDDMKKDPLPEYSPSSEPDQYYKSYAWSTGIGLQAVDGLKTSDYLIQTAVQNIEGSISFEEANALIKSYYEQKFDQTSEGNESREADLVAARIAQLISEPGFNFSPSEYISIHQSLFQGIYRHAGKIRDWNISKDEWVLNGKSVTYGNAKMLRENLKYDFSEEENFSYQNLTEDDVIQHLASFISRLWQNHIFGEGNTRTTAVFFIKYLRSLGYDVTNEVFAKHAWYFRNALVRANYNDYPHKIYETTEFLEVFLRNLLLNENHPLRNRDLHINAQVFHLEKPDIGGGKPDIGGGKPDIGELKPDVGEQEPDIGDECIQLDELFTRKTADHIRTLFYSFGTSTIFGRSDVSEKTGLKTSQSSELIKKLILNHFVISVQGKGKGKIRFVKKIR